MGLRRCYKCGSTSLPPESDEFCRECAALLEEAPDA